jgi:hypothetical protein
MLLSKSVKMQKGISILGKDPQTALKVSLVNL